MCNTSLTNLQIGFKGICKKVLIFLLGGHYAYCSYGIDHFKNMGIWKTENPKPGDVIIFKNTSGAACHTGIVYAGDNKRVYTIEGNTSSASGVVANGGCVAKKSYSLSYSRIMGKGFLKGNENGELGLTNELLRVFVVNDRAGIYDRRWDGKVNN